MNVITPLSSARRRDNLTFWN